MKQRTTLVLIAVAMILAAAMSRIAFYPLNFSPVIAMALFAGAVIKDKKLAFILPLAAMFLSDVLFEITNIAPGFWGWGQLIGYGIFALITVLGFNLKKINVLNVAGFSVISSLIFFFLSNSSVWLLSSNYYAPNFTGFTECLAAGIPFLKNGIAADLVYSAVFFGGYVLLEKFAFKKSVAS
jgi:hypothetical protein